MSEAFQMPQVEAGEIVLYAVSKHSVDWRPLYVSEVYENNISGTIMQELVGIGPALRRENVVHANDPRLDDPRFVARQAEEEDQGVFVLHPSRLRMEGILERLSGRIEKLENGAASNQVPPLARTLRAAKKKKRFGKPFPSAASDPIAAETAQEQAGN